MKDTRMLNEAYNSYYKTAVASLEECSLSIAKRNFLLAAETLLKIAKESEPTLAKRRQKTAQELIEVSEKIEEKIQASKKKAKKINVQEKEEHGQTTFSQVKDSSLRFDDVAGLVEVKDMVNKIAILPEKYPEIYQAFKKKRGGGILLYGLPGTGKTMIAKAIAGELGAAFYSVKCSDIMSKWVGDSEQNVRNLFAEARKSKTAVIFFDEIEAIAAKRDINSSVMKRVIPELLAQMQGFEEHKDSTLLLIGATNRPWDIDSAFLRPGRFDNQVYVPLPDNEAREAIIKGRLKGVPVSEEFDYALIVEKTRGMNGADIADSFCEKMKDNAIKRNLENGSESNKIEKINNNDILEVSQKVFSSVKQAEAEKFAKYKTSIEGL